MGVKDKDKDLVPDRNSTSSILLNVEDMTLASDEDGYEGLDLNAEQKHLCGFYKEEQGEEHPEHQGNKHLKTLREKHQSLRMQRKGWRGQ